MTIGRKTLAGIVISSGPGGYFETYEGTSESDDDEEDNNKANCDESQVKPPSPTTLQPPIATPTASCYNHNNINNCDSNNLHGSYNQSFNVESELKILEASDVDNLLQQFEANEDSLLTPNSGSDPNQASQIISAVQNHFATSSKNVSGEGVTPKIVRSQRIKDALPVEIIEKIKASSQRSKTIAIIEPLTSKTARDNSIESSGSRVPKSSGIESRFKEAACNLNRNKLRQLGITQSPQQVQKVSLDHDYCSPSKPKRGRYLNNSSSKENRSEQTLKKRSLLIGNKQTQNKLIIASSQVISRRDSDNRKDSGLESGDVSDASDSSSSGNVKGGLKPGLYSKLPPYLTTLKSQKQSNKAFVPVLDGTGNSYDRLPPYIKGIVPHKKGNTNQETTTPESLLKTTNTNNISLTSTKEKKKLNLVQYRNRREELMNNANRKTESPVTIVELSDNGKAGIILEKTIPVFDKPVPTTTGTTTIAGRSAIPPRQYRQNMKSPPPHLRSSSSSSSSSASSPSSSSSSSEDEYSSSRRRRQHRRKRRRSVSSDSISSGSSRRISSSSSRRRRDESRGRRRSSSRSSISRSRSRRSRDRFSVDRRHDQKRRGDDRVYSERKVVYVGKIKEGTTRADIRKRFESFGPIEEISVHFRDRGDNYGFVTFKYRSDAYNAIEHGNDNPSLPKVDLCFGGRRTFCKEKYSDLDSLNNSESAVGYSALDLDYDLLLKKARGQIKKN
ncbi:uncharacterized protein [Lepeophtheirus salmonis]|uniref:uncharacterized protein isoform X2 n=1 Tax=Lepeophtheirus salmonis TaxID=72036 RepID=UPI001AE75AF9|nr:uncharacterized protein DDB_G0284459-like isoform X2 [Lepeophtheirus salmonis]